MIRTVIVSSAVAALLLGAATAQPTQTALNLEVARDNAPGHDPAVDAAGARVERAQEAVARVERDPFALRLDRVAARHELEAATAALAQARAESKRAVTDAYLAVIEAELALEVAALAEEIAGITLDATRLRFEHGAVTQHDVDSAQPAPRPAPAC